MSDVVLMTGATGFVGLQVLRVLSAQGKKVRLVIRRETHSRLVVNEDTVESVIETDDLFAENADWWKGVCAEIDTVIHVAWYAEPGKYLHSSYNLDCLAGTIAMAKGATQAGVRRFIGIGTCIEYDLTNRFVSIETPLKPSTPYAASKAAAFIALSQFLPLQGVEFAWCRLFYLYGEGEDERRLVPYLHKQLASGKPAELTNGSQIRDFLDVREAGRMIVDIALGKEQGPVNICSGIPFTVRQLAEKIADEYGRRDLLKFGARPDNPLDPPCIVGIRKQANS
jgi:nucleoside-diphosphate-sugar epimerase